MISVDPDTLIVKVVSEVSDCPYDSKKNVSSWLCHSFVLLVKVLYWHMKLDVNIHLPALGKVLFPDLSN